MKKRKWLLSVIYEVEAETCTKSFDIINDSVSDKRIKDYTITFSREI